MRSDSPRVAAAQESRRASINSGAGANKRLSLDKEYLDVGVAYDSPTMLPRRPLIPEAFGQEHEPATKEECDQSETVSLHSSGTSEERSSEAGSSHTERHLLSKAIDVMMARVRRQDDASSDTDDEMVSSLKDSPVLGESQLRFDLSVPSPLVDAPTIHFVCETASRLLFQTPHWTKSIHAFNLLKYDTQIGLVRNSWADLFVLGLAQIAGQVSIPSILSLIVSHQQSRLARDNTPINVKEVTASICKIHEYVQALAKLNIDEKEFAYLRAIALFGAGDYTSLPDRHQMEYECALKTPIANFACSYPGGVPIAFPSAEHSPVQCRILQHNTVHHSALQYIVLRYIALQCSLPEVRCSREETSRPCKRAVHTVITLVLSRKAVALLGLRRLGHQLWSNTHRFCIVQTVGYKGLCLNTQIASQGYLDPQFAQSLYPDCSNRATPA
jgi:hypothetical protein